MFGPDRDGSPLANVVGKRPYGSFGRTKPGGWLSSAESRYSAPQIFRLSPSGLSPLFARIAPQELFPTGRLERSLNEKTSRRPCV